MIPDKINAAIEDVKRKRLTSDRYPREFDVSDIKTYSVDGVLVDINHLESKLIFYRNPPIVPDRNTGRIKKVPLGKCQIELRMSLDAVMDVAADIGIEVIQFLERVKGKKKTKDVKIIDQPLFMFG